MNLNNPQNQGYWFVVREDQRNVIFSSSNFTIQNPQTGQEAKYVVDTGDNRQFIQINEVPTLSTPEVVLEHTDGDETKETIINSNIWDRQKIKLFLTMCLENNFRNVSKDKDLLEVIAAHIGSTPDECISKYKSLRRTFIRLLKKKRLGKEIKWVHYNMCDKVFNECKSLPPSVIEPWDEHKVRCLLNLYIDNIGRFQSSECLQKDIWKDIATQLGTTEYNCYHKFKNLKSMYLKRQQRSRETGKPVKWPYHQYFETILYNYNPNTGPWNRNKTRKLIDAYLQIADKFRNPRYQKKDLWKEVSVIVGESAASCDKKFRNLKQTFIKLRMRANAGRCITKWRYYKDFENIFNCTNPWKSIPTESHKEDYVNQLLSFYVKNKEKFQNPCIKKKKVWRLIGPKLGLTPDGCARKFRNLKQTYVRLAEKKALTGKLVRWPYYHYFESIFEEPRMSGNNKDTCTEDDMSMCDIQRVVQHIQNDRECDNFHKLCSAMKESNDIQRDRNTILLQLLNRHT